MSLRIVMPGKVKFRLCSRDQFTIKHVRDFLASALINRGILVHESSGTEINFEVPFVIFWKWDASILFLISSGEIELIPEGKALKIKYRLNLRRLFLYLIVPGIIFLMWEFSFQAMIFRLIILLLFLSILVLLIIYGFRGLIKRCATNYSQRSL